MSTQQDPDGQHEQPFEKHAEIAKTDNDRQIAVGVAMVPNSVDRSGDFERADVIQRASEGYMERLAKGEAKSGVMHADFDDAALTHVENRVLDKAEDIGGERYPAGTWAVSKRVDDDALWKLVENGTLSGFSIGGWVHDAKTHAADALPNDVEASADGDTAREITEMSVEEVSLVDTPAVAEAQILTAKGDGLLKANPALTESAEAATEYLVDERGHDEESARDLAEYLNRTGKSAPSGNSADSGGWVARAKSFFTPRGRGSGGQNTTPDPSDHEMTETEKAGRTLSSSNTDRVKALHDIAIDVLNDAGEAQNRLRFTDDISTSFDVNEFQSKATSDSPAGESGRDADTDTENTMSDTDIEEMLKSIKETQEEQAERMEALESDDDGEEKAEDDDDPVADLAETVESLANQQGQILDRIENAEGTSQQNPNADPNADGGVSKADVLGLPNMGD
jgi:hypothetical protein